MANPTHPRAEQAAALLAALAARAGLAEVPQLRLVPGRPGATRADQPAGRPPVLYVTTQLLDRAPDPVLQAVLAHEIGHLVHADAAHRRRIGLALIAAGLALLAVILTQRAWLTAIVIPLGLVIVVLTALARFRRLELTADRTSQTLVGTDATAAAVSWLCTDRLTHGTRPERLWVALRMDDHTCSLFSTHPGYRTRLLTLLRPDRP